MHVTEKQYTADHNTKQYTADHNSKQYTADHNTKQYTADHNTKQYTADHNTKHIYDGAYTPAELSPIQSSQIHEDVAVILWLTMATVAVHTYQQRKSSCVPQVFSLNSRFTQEKVERRK
jgi:hypothetical protein